MEREVGVGIGMGNTCKPMAVSFQCMTKFTTNKKKEKKIKMQDKYEKKKAVLQTSQGSEDTEIYPPRTSVSIPTGEKIQSKRNKGSC